MPTVNAASPQTAVVVQTGAAVAIAPLLKESNSFIIKALSGNANKSYVGPSTVTIAAATQGHELSPGESLAVDHRDPSLWFTIGTAPDRVTLTIVKP